MPRWRHCLVTAILFVVVVLHASTGQPPFLRKGRSPLFLWAAPTKDVPTLRIHGGTLAQGKGREHFVSDCQAARAALLHPDPVVFPQTVFLEDASADSIILQEQSS